MLLNSVQLQIDRDDDRKYLRVRIPDSKKMPVYRYQIEMIANNPSESIIPFEYHRKDHDYFFYYNIQSRISLRDYIEKHRFSKNEFIDLLTGITENILESRRLLLNEQNFLLDEEHIYLTQESALPGLIYIPAGSGLFRLQEFKDLVIRLIAKAAFTMGRGGGGFLYRIIGYLKEDSFSLPGFKRLLEDLKEGSGNGVENDVFTMNGGSKDVFNGENEFLNDEADINRGGSRNDVLNGRRLVYAAISQIVIITLAVFADWVLKSRGLMQVLRYGLITAMVLAYDAIILKLLIFRRSRTGQELARDTCLEDSDLSNMQDLDVANLRNSDMAQMQNPNMAGMQDLNIQDSKEKYLQGFKDKPDLYSDANGASDRQLQIEETSLLCGAGEAGVFLVCRDKGMVKEFRIDKDRLIIGRNPDVCDIIVDNKTVGRIHAEIFKKDHSFYIIDKNSRNGTYLNDQRLDGGVEYKLNSGDSIVFANVEYGFIA